MNANFRIKDAACDVERIKKRFFASKGENAVKNLKKMGLRLIMQKTGSRLHSCFYR